MLTFFYTLLLIHCNAVDPVRPLEGRHPQAVLGLAVSPSGGQMASLSRDGTILIWDLKSQRPLARHSVSKLALTIIWPQPDRLVTVGAMAFEVLDTNTGKISVKHTIGKRSDAGAISLDGRFAAVGNTHFTGRIMDAVTGKSLKPYPSTVEWSYAMDVSADNSLLAIGGCSPDDDSISLYETKGFTSQRHWQTKLKGAVGLRFSPNSKLIACSGLGDVAKVWKIEDGSLLHSFSVAHTHAPTLGFSSDSRLLVVCSGVPSFQLYPHHYDYAPPEDAKNDKPTPILQCWNLATKEEIWRSEMFSSWATSLRFVNNRSFITGHYDGTVRFWELPDQAANSK